MSVEKFCLKVNNFHSLIIDSFQVLRKDSDFCDVTLVSEDNQQIKAHKVILAVSSPVLMEMISSTKHSHPLIYMRGTRAADLTSMVDFIYNGEVNISYDNLGAFLNLSEDLQLKGLTSEDNTVEVKQEGAGEYEQLSVEENKLSKKFSTNTTEFNIEKENLAGAVVSMTYSKNYVVDPNADFEDLDEKLLSTIEKIDGIWTCKVCGLTKKRNDKTDMKRHAEIHIKSASYPCKLCGKLFRSSNAISRHIINHILNKF